MTNWSTDFKNSFKDLALNNGDAGDIIITGIDIRGAKPDFDEVVGEVRVYSNNEAGRKKIRKG